MQYEYYDYDCKKRRNKMSIVQGFYSASGQGISYFHEIIRNYFDNELKTLDFVLPPEGVDSIHIKF